MSDFKVQEIIKELQKEFPKVYKKGGIFSRSFYTLYGPNIDLDKLVSKDLNIVDTIYSSADFLFYYRFGDGTRLALTNSYFYFSGIPDDGAIQNRLQQGVSAIKQVSHFTAAPVALPVFRIDFDNIIKIILTSQSIGGSFNRYTFHFMDINQKSAPITTQWNRDGDQIYNSIVRLINTFVCRENLLGLASVKEKNLDYDSAIEIYEEMGEVEEAGRIRKLKTEKGAVKVKQTVVHGDYVDDRDTIVKDSVINKSNIGSGSSSKAEELREVKALLDDGIIDDDEFKQMKKEILGK